MKKESHLKKVFFTIIIAFAIISFWRGTWGLMDIYLFPNSHVMSFSVSILAGVIILYLTKNLVKRLV